MESRHQPSSNTASQRNPLIDTVRGVAIVLVVLGHCIQCGSGTNYMEKSTFFSNPLFMFIYAFHMPLFMLVSGYLFGFSINRGSRWDILKRKAKGLLIPLMAWHALYLIVFGLTGNKMYVSFIIRTYLNVYTLWYFRVLFFCICATLAADRLFPSRLWPLVVMAAAQLLVPTNIMSPLYCFMFPYFVCGYAYNRSARLVGWGSSLTCTPLRLLLTTAVLITVFLIVDTRGRDDTKAYWPEGTIVSCSKSDTYGLRSYYMVVMLRGHYAVFHTKLRISCYS